MTLKQLEAFYWAAQLGSFAAAATRLCVTQSSLSKRISELETELGKQLFSRSGQRAIVTGAGEQLLSHAARMLEIEASIRADLEVEDSVRGVCRFGISELGASTWLPQLVASVRMLYPLLVLEPHVDLTRNLERLVARGELDFAVIPGPSPMPQLASKRIASLQYAWMASPTRLARGTMLTATHFAQHPVITLSPEAALTQSFERWASEQRLQIPRALTCNSLLALIGLTTAGVGISFFPRFYVQPLVDRGRLVELTSERPLPDLHYCFLWRMDDTRRLVTALQSVVAREADFSLRAPGSPPSWLMGGDAMP